MLLRSMFCRTIAFYFLLLYMAILSAGCVAPTSVAPSSLDCADLKLDRFASAVQPTDYTSDSMAAWISHEFGVEDSTVLRNQERVLEDDHTADVFEWQGGRQRLRLDIVNGIPVALFGGWVQSPPTVAQVIECLGEPAAYVAALHDEPVLEQPVVGFRMFYPSTGTVISAFVPVDPSGGGAPGSVLAGNTFDASDAFVNDLTVLTTSTAVEDLLDHWLLRRMSANDEETENARSAYYHASLFPFEGDLTQIPYEMTAAP